MSEIKRTFQAGKMNKDLDERIVPNGEYRDALNIQIRTSDGDAVGTVQNIKSTEKVWNGTDKNDDSKSYYKDWMGNATLNINNKPSLPEVIGSVADEKNDKIYFFIKAPNFQDTIKIFTDNAYNAASLITSERKFSDCILEYNVKDSTESPVVVDNFAIINTFAEISPSHPTINTMGSEVDAYTRINVASESDKYRPGMTIKAVKNDGTNVFPNGEVVKIKNYENGVITLYGEHTKNIFDSSANNITHFIFEHEDRPLNFSSELTNSNINATNIIDNLLFWTDNKNEPKKINIDRCKEGSDGFYIHTKLCVTNPSVNNYSVVTNVDQGLLDYPTSPWLKEEHITVIRKAPTYAPTLHMSKSNREGLTSGYFQNFAFTSSNENDEDYNTANGDEIVISNDIFFSTLFVSGDILTFYQTDAGLETEPIRLTAKFLYYEDFCGNDTCTETDCTEDIDGDGEINSGVPANAGGCQVTNRIRVEMLYVDSSLNEFDLDWSFELEQRDPLFELKMGRFGLRYKYEDGEYSSFGPWSELAFLPGDYNYQSRKGYNLGMVNTVRELIVKDFIPYLKPLDIVAVDLLWKTVDSPSVYVVSTIERAKDSEWEEFSTDIANNNIKTGELHITSEMIHKVVSSTQILRSWDNVPRYALAQEIIGNRLLYANYVQGYDFKYPVSLSQNIISDNSPSLSTPQKSIKSLRDYKFGMVFGDRYGRETPVMTSGYVVSQEDADNAYAAFTGDVRTLKSLSSKKNSIQLTQLWNSTISANNVPHDWIDYVKYYVKEPSNEYYNLVMDRWYWCEDEQRNIWLSFNSADRNKIDEESYLILKNKHNSHEAVIDTAKYKVLAIENDVPEYVRNVQLDLQKCPMREQSSGITHVIYDQSDVPLVMWDQCLLGQSPSVSICEPVTKGKTTKKLFVGVNEWNIHTGAVPYDWATGEMGTISHPLGKVIEGQLKIRVSSKCDAGGARYLHTRWQNVSSWRVVQYNMTNSATGDSVAVEIVEFTFSEEFGEEIDMYTRWRNIIGVENLTLVDSSPSCCFDQYRVDGLEYYIQLREDIPEHKAEYDGKFFAKIEADGVVSSSVVGATTSSQSYVPRRSFPIHYVASQRSNLGEQNGGLYTGDEADFDGYVDENGNTVAAFYGAFPSAVNAINQSNIDTAFGGTATGCAANAGEEYYQATQTKTFWNAFRLSTSDQHGGGTTCSDILDVAFLDDARMVNGKMDVSDFANENSTEVEGPYTPSAFDVGIEEIGGSVGVSSGFGRMTLSYLGTSEFTPDAPPDPGDLKYELSQVGTLFRWTGDPNNENNIYQVVAYHDDNAYISNDGGYGSNYLENDCSICNEVNTVCNGGFPIPDNNIAACHRRTYQVEFRKIELFTGDLASNGTVGMDLEQWDPRSNMTHWGQLSQTLEIIELQSSSFSTNGEVIDGAVWETEPKGGVELDIYYEASNAIPIRLTEDNIYNFAPIDSEISVRRSYGSGDNITWTNISLSEAYNYRSWMGDKNKNQAFVYIRKFNPQTETWSNCSDILENDLIKFTHKDGTVTTTKVTGVGKYSTDSYDDDSLSSTLVEGYPYVVIENSASLGEIGDNLFAFMYSSGQGETTTITNPNDETDTIIAPRIFITRRALFWPLDDGSEALAAMDDEFGDLPITACEVFNNGLDSFTSIPDSDGSSNTLSSSTKVTVSELVGASFTSTSSDIDGDGNIDILGPAENDQNQFNITSVTSFNSCAWLEIKLSFEDYALLPTDTTGSPDEFLDLDGDGIFDDNNPDYNPNYGNIIGFLWRVNDFTVNPTGLYAIDTEVWQYPTKLGWHNCYSFGNGAESDRIRDDYNAPQIDNGVKVSTTFSGYSKETKGSGMIYSGLYNSISEVNDLNEFNISQKITKNLNPAYGSIQALKTRDTDVVVLAEDKILKVLANKDALYNADGNPQLTATDKVLGTAMPFVGDYGISKNPESLAFDQFRMYFTDKQRGAVLRLSRDGLTPISNVGMKTYFRENLPKAESLLGTFDIVNGEYNLTLHGYESEDDKTVSFNEGAKGWVSFKSFIPNAGESTSGKYITAYNYELFDHYNESATTYNEFYDTQYKSSIKLIFNDLPGSIKSFKTINYEGSQSRVNQAYDLANTSTVTDANNNTVNTEDGEYYNLSAKEGWYVNSFETDLQSGSVPEFIDKENKWFNKINGITTDINNLDSNEFTVQGIGNVTWIYNYDIDSGDDGVVPDATTPGCTDETACNYDNQATIDDGSCEGPTQGVGYDCDGNCTTGYNDFSDGLGCVQIITGCMDSNYLEYNSSANTSDVGQCLTLITSGCMDPDACNYSDEWLYNDYALCVYEADCAGVCGGTSVDLGCGCGNPAALLNADCDGNCLDGYVLDENGDCTGDGIPDDQIWSISNYTDDSSATIEGVCGDGQVWDADQGICVDG